MNYVEEWKKAKRAFENATGKKKPSSYFAGLIKQKTGISGALGELGRALKSDDLDAMDKAIKAYTKVATAYTSTLDKAARKEKSADVKQEIGKLEKALKAISDDAGAAISRARKIAKARAASEDIIRMLTTTHLKDFRKAHARAEASFNKVQLLQKARLKAASEHDDTREQKIVEAMKTEIDSELYDRGVAVMDSAQTYMADYQKRVEQKNRTMWDYLDDNVVEKNFKLINEADKKMVVLLRQTNEKLKTARTLVA